jgi:hypothetical protein
MIKAGFGLLGVGDFTSSSAMKNSIRFDWRKNVAVRS